MLAAISMRAARIWSRICGPHVYAAAMRALRAFSIIELLTALVLLAVGLASAVRAAGAVARLERDARLRRTVAAALRARLDTLRGEPCGSEPSGQAATQGITERWHAVTVGTAFSLTDTVDVAARPSLGRLLVLRIACRP